MSGQISPALVPLPDADEHVCGTCGYEISLHTPGQLVQHDQAQLNHDQAVTIGALVRLAADMIGEIPNDELGDDDNVTWCNALSALIRRAAGIPPELAYIVDDAIGWAGC